MLILFLFLVFIIIYNYESNIIKEPFKYDRTYGKFCPHSCSKFDNSLNHCLECANCGIISLPDKSLCVSGDSYGPYDKNYKNYKWTHNNEFTRHLNKHKIHAPYVL
jgi:hypothetical protein